MSKNQKPENKENKENTENLSKENKTNDSSSKISEREVSLLQKQIEDLTKELDGEKAEKAELNDKYLRMAAEYDNFRKRAQKEKDGIYSDAQGDTVEKLLPVLDNLQRALLSSSDNTDAIAEGLKQIEKQFVEILGKMEVREIPALGESFNPELHNAVLHEENSELGENTVSEVFMKGYTIKDKVIRHSMVKVVN